MPLEQIQLLIAHYGYAAIFCLLVLGIVGLPIPDETLLTLTGYLVFKGTLHPVPAFLSAFLGTVCGISMSFAIGRVGGMRVLRRYGPRVHIRTEQIDRVKSWLNHRGRWSLAIGYFVPGVRHLIAIVAGGSGLRINAFALYAYTGACVWSVTFLGAGYFLGEGWSAFPDLMRRIAVALFVLGILAAGAYWLTYRRKQRKKH